MNKKRLKKYLVSFLSASMLLSQGVSITYAEGISSPAEANKLGNVKEAKELEYNDLSHVFNGDFSKNSHWVTKTNNASYNKLEGDNYYGIPLATESIALFYNKTLLEENGFEVATTFEELIEQAKQYNDAAANKFLFRFDAGNSYTMHPFLTSAGFELYGPNHDDASQVNLNTPEVVKGLTFYQSLKEILPVPYADLNWDSIEVEFAKGNVPYIITGPWSIAEVRNQNTGFEWGVTTIPTINGVQPETFSGNIIACISAYTQHVAESKQVLEFLASEEGLKILYDVKGSIPALKDNSVIEGVLEDPYVSGILAQAEFSQPMPILPEMSSYWGPVETMYRSVWEGLATPEQAAEKALADYNAALELAQ